MTSCSLVLLAREALMARKRHTALPQIKEGRAIKLEFPAQCGVPKVMRQLNHDRQSRPRQITVLLLCLGMTVYFAHHAFNGRHGLEARSRLTERSALLEFEIKSLEAVRAKLERDVALLTPQLADPDIVEEVARDVLGFVHPDDRMVIGR